MLRAIDDVYNQAVYQLPVWQKKAGIFQTVLPQMQWCPDFYNFFWLILKKDGKKENSTNTRICTHKFITVMHQQEVFWSPSYLPFSDVQKFHSLLFLFCVIIMYCHLPASENTLSWTFKLELRNLVQPSYVEVYV